MLVQREESGRPNPGLTHPGFPVAKGSSPATPHDGQIDPKCKWPCLKGYSLQCEKCDLNNDYGSIANQTISTVTEPVTSKLPKYRSLETVFTFLALTVE
jgi:hypothetical protein